MMGIGKMGRKKVKVLITIQMVISIKETTKKMLNVETASYSTPMEINMKESMIKT